MALVLDPEGNLVMLHQMAAWRAEGEGWGVASRSHPSKLLVGLFQ